MTDDGYPTVVKGSFSRSIRLGFAAVAIPVYACGGKLDNPGDFAAVYQPSGASAGGTTSAASSTATSTGGGGSGGTGGVAGGPGCDVAAALSRRCGGIVCHGGVAAPQLELIAPGAEQRLIDQPATYSGVAPDDAPNCPMPPELLINTADPPASLMLKKLDGMQACGSPMPLSVLPGSTQDDDTCIREWAVGLTMGMTTGL